MLTLAGVSASAPPLVTSGIALAMPPVPVVTPTPAPVRRNQVSSVKLVAPRAGAVPNVTYCVDAVQLQGACAEFADGVAVTVADAGDAWLAASTATTT